MSLFAWLGQDSVVVLTNEKSVGFRPVRFCVVPAVESDGVFLHKRAFSVQDKHFVNVTRMRDTKILTKSIPVCTKELNSVKRHVSKGENAWSFPYSWLFQYLRANGNSVKHCAENA